MPTLSEKQLSEGYYAEPESFMGVALRTIQTGSSFSYKAVQVKDYKGQDKLWLACTQLYNTKPKEQKRIVNEWAEFLQTNTKTIKLLYFRSRVPQALFDAACYQENLEELHFKWGGYKDLSALNKLSNSKHLKHLYIGSGAGVEDILPLTEMKNLVSLYIENFKRIADYSPIAKLQNLEQLVISGPILGNTPIQDLEFLRDMPNLRSFFHPGTTIKRKYTEEDWEKLRADLSHLKFMSSSEPF